MNIKEENKKKERHGCATSWLILMIVLNSLGALSNFFLRDEIKHNLQRNIPDNMLIILGIIGILNVIFAIMIFRWKKLGFWGFTTTSIIVLAINLYLGLGIRQSLLGLIGIVILYAILHIKKNNISTWESLD